MKQVTPIEDRLFARVDADGPCWLWLGAKSAAGYGVIGVGRRGEGIAYTHRVAWETLVGPIPDGLDLDHLCRVRHCCNPDHLEPVTRATNTARGFRNTRKSHCRWGHTLTRENTITRSRQRYCRTCRTKGSHR